MKAGENEWPEKLRELQNFLVDSTIWNDFRFRDGDVVVGTWAKSGTTWLQQIVGQLVFNGAEHVPVGELSPWLDLRIHPRKEILAALDSQKHRRFLKTHLPVESLVISPDAKYIYIGRDGRDMLWSMHAFHSSFTELFYALVNEMPGRVGPALGLPNPDVRRYFHDWLDKDGFPFWPFWSHVQSWWNIRHLPNVLLVHFANLKADLAGQMRDIAEFIGIELDETTWPVAVAHCTFDYMKKHAANVTTVTEATLQGGAQSLVNRGTNGRWRDVLTPSDVRKYHECANRNLSRECAHWLETGAIP